MGHSGWYLKNLKIHDKWKTNSWSHLGFDWLIAELIQTNLGGNVPDCRSSNWLCYISTQQASPKFFFFPEYVFLNSLDLNPFRPMASHSTGLLLSMNAPLEIVWKYCAGVLLAQKLIAHNVLQHPLSTTSIKLKYAASPLHANHPSLI